MVEHLSLGHANRILIEGDPLPVRLAKPRTPRPQSDPAGPRTGAGGQPDQRRCYGDGGRAGRDRRRHFLQSRAPARPLALDDRTWAPVGAADAGERIRIGRVTLS
jgi:hypothetical protein